MGAHRQPQELGDSACGMVRMREVQDQGEVEDEGDGEMGRWGDGEDEVTKSPPIPFTAWHAALRLQVPKSPMDRPMRWCEGLGGLMAGFRQDFRSNWPLVLIQ